MQAYFDLRVSDFLPQGSLHWWFLNSQGMAASSGNSNFFRVFFHCFFELNIFQSTNVDASQLSRIVELRFLDSPLLLFLSLSCF